MFYALALVPTVFCLYANYIDTSLYRWHWPLALFQRGSVALALFALVMFVGVFAQGSKSRALLFPLRRQFAIIGSVLALGHVVVYTAAFVPQLLDGDIRLDRNIVASLAVALAVTLLLAALAATSTAAPRLGSPRCRGRRLERKKEAWTAKRPGATPTASHIPSQALPARTPSMTASRTSQAASYVGASPALC